MLQLKSKQNKKNKVAYQLRLVWKSNQDGSSKCSTAPQLAEAVIIDRNFKEHSQNQVNEKELP